MDDPIKIIWKYKNKNRRTQYHTYIYIGPVAKNIMQILEKIKDENLYNTLVKLSKTDIKILEEKYGEYWYNKFFNTYHLSSTISLIRETPTQNREIIDKFGKDWYERHIEKPQIIEKKLLYSYESLIKDEKDRKMIKKTRNYAQSDDDIDLNYTTYKQEDISKILDDRTKLRRLKITSEKKQLLDDTKDIIMKGGMEDELDTLESVSEELGESLEDIFGDGEIKKPQEEDEEELEQGELLPEEEIEMKEIEELYKEVDVNPDSNVSKTSQLIKEALKDDKLFEKRHSSLLDFDTSKDNNIYDEYLKDIYKKYYVTSYYIFKDDTIKMIKDKICCSIKNNPIFDKNSFLIPSRQYLWSQYYFNNNLDKVMIGHKWLKRNEILTIDIEPNNNLRYYEELRGNLKSLRDNIKRYGHKIKMEDDDTNILYDYDGYYTNNEIFMIDIYNELGSNYSSDTESVKNLSDLYVKIYFPKMRGDDFKHVIEYLNGDKKVEQTKTSTIYDNILNDLVMETEIMYMVEDVKKSKEYTKSFKENIITQSVIHVNLRLLEGTKIDLFRIFNEFEASSKYPFIQYQTHDNQIVFKFKEDDIYDYLKVKENANVLSKWFETAPYGISFKYKIEEKGVVKFMQISLNETGRIEYKTTWKETDMATIEDIRKTYNYVKDLIKQINQDKNKVKFDIPDDSEFKYAFINTIQKFELPEDYNIDHNDLSDFSRYFFPYIAMVIEPRKRQAKVQQKNVEKGKSGTYLRYKRVSKYDSQARMEQRIMYFMRNYEYTDQLLANEISKQFNITMEKAIEDIEKVKKRYPYLKKSRKVLKKLENIPKYKSPGIGIDIQGKQRDNYKIRISGARDKAQLDRIMTFMNILIHMYIETYLLKKPERQILKEKLKKLTNIAKRRSKVENFVNYSKEIKSVKQMAQVDKQRIGFKPEKGQNQWTRSCQNSGNDKKRRPQQYNSRNMEELLKQGFVLNKKTGSYERRAILKVGNKKKEVVVKTVKLQEYDNDGNATGNEIHYACGPEENGEHYFVGFLTKSNNPFGHCMPCCFKKDHATSKNKEKRDFFYKCLGQQQKIVEEGVSQEDVKMIAQKNITEKLYILQDTNKIQDGRFGFLPKYMDFFFNFALDKQRKIKSHYLAKTETGYFFKYGTKQDELQFLNAICAIYDTTIEEIREKMISVLEEDKNDIIFTSLNNGDIKTQFTTRENYIQFIRYNNYLDFNMVNNLLSIPKVLSPYGCNMIVFDKKITVIKKELEKEKTKEDFFLLCQNTEEVHTIDDPNKETFFILKENKNYYPIIMVIKPDENNKNIELVKRFKYEEKKDNIIYHIKPYYEKNCQGSFMDEVVFKYSLQTAKKTKYILNSLNDKTLIIKYQIVDIRNKCKYLITNNGTVIPVRPSGSLYDVQIIKSLEKYIDTFENTIRKMTEISQKTKNEINILPFGVYYSERIDKKINLTGIITKTHDVVPIIEVEKETKELDKMGLIYENKPLYEKIDNILSKGTREKVIDDRIIQVNNNKYHDESYELFRYEFSEFINREENQQLKKKLENIINDANIEKKHKIQKIRLFIYKLVDKELHSIYKEISYTQDDDNNQEGGANDKFINIINKLPNLLNYQIKNEREICPIHTSKEQCYTNPHCSWAYDKCYQGLTKEMLTEFVNRISEELASGELKSFEIMKVGNYFVSDIVDYTRYKEKEGQKIVRSSSNTIKKVLNELFGKENIPTIGKRRALKSGEITTQQMNIDNNIKDLKDMYSQSIIKNNLTLFRAYVNAYYWIKHPYYDIESRNLGYYSQTQTDLCNYFRSLIIDWMQDSNNEDIINKQLINYIEHRKNTKYIIDDFITKLGNDIGVFTNCIVELFILNKIHKLPIVVYDDDNNVLYVFNDGFIYNSKINKTISKDIEKILKDRKLNINLRFTMYSGKSIPDDIEVLYYK